MESTGNLDYSKWDNLDISSDEEDDCKPIVTTFDKPSSVTIGPGGYTINKTPPKPATQPTKRRKPNPIPLEWSLNGNKLDEYVWSQTRDFVEVRFFVPKGTRGSDVKFELNSTSCKVFIKDETFIEGVFCFEIHAVEDESDIDWELIEHPSVEGRILVLSGLQKKPPKGLYNWWDTFFKREEPIDIKQLKGRKSPKQEEVWKIAHEMFKNKVQNQGKIPVPVFVEDDDMAEEVEKVI